MNVKLPKPAYYSVNDLSARWGCTNADIAGWAASGNFDILTGIPPVTCTEDVIAGEVVLRPFDMISMFRRCGTGPQVARVRRVRKKDLPIWSLITTPRKGVKVCIETCSSPPHKCIVSRKSTICSAASAVPPAPCLRMIGKACCKL